jgi:uroporphyrinogen-III synthase
MPMPRVIVTRPHLEAGPWVESLVEQGFSAEALPLIEIAAIAQPATLPSLEDFDALMFVSSNAVRYFFDEKPLSLNKKVPTAQSIRAEDAIKSVAADRSHGHPTPGRPRFMAPGPGTVSALRRAGVPAHWIDSPAADSGQFDSEALWREIGARDWAGKRVLVVRGQTRALTDTDTDTDIDAPAPGRDWLARQWQAAGALVGFVSVYERFCPRFTPAQRQLAEAASADGSVWLLSSSEALKNLADSLGIAPGRARALATHPRIAEAARRAGWGVVAESRPALPDIVQCLRSIEWPEP